uniref:GCR126 n=1 Tax=Schmidtea mediterranea TaxID=79327 RepID=A0A193KUM0_SCHMD|nr:GCR126 [Schmidtea mediterranea]
MKILIHEIENKYHNKNVYYFYRIDFLYIMYYLTPVDDSMEKIEDKFSPFYNIDKKKCLKLSNSSCISTWVFQVCLTDSMRSEDNEILCPFFTTYIQPVCSNGRWDYDDRRVYEDCYTKEFYYRLTIERTFMLLINPFILLIYQTGVYYISEYPEIVKDFNWRFVVWLLKSRSIHLFILISMCFINSSRATYEWCMLFTFLPLTLDLFYHTSMLALFIHVYAIIFNQETQLRVIKSSLKHFCFIMPLLIAIVCLILDIGTKGHSYFQCQCGPILSRVYYVYVATTLVQILIAFPLYLRIMSKLKTIELENNLRNHYRMEYDILGERKEVSKRELVRCKLSMKVFLLLSIWNFVMYCVMVINRIILPNRLVYKIMVIIYSSRNIADCIMLTILIWFNKGLRQRMAAWDLWNNVLNVEVKTNQNDADFLLAIQETTK